MQHTDFIGFQQFNTIMSVSGKGAQLETCSRERGEYTMATYILLISTTDDGRRKILDDPHIIRAAEEEMGFSGAEILGLYAVLGNIDFVAILEAEDNATAARFTLELGVRAGLQTTTMPAIPIGRLEGRSGDRPGEQSTYTVIGSGATEGAGAS